MRVLKDCKIFGAAFPVQFAQLIFANIHDSRHRRGHTHADFVKMEVSFPEFVEGMLAASCFINPNPYTPLYLKFRYFLSKVLLPNAKKVSIRSARRTEVEEYGWLFDFGHLGTDDHNFHDPHEDDHAHMDDHNDHELGKDHPLNSPSKLDTDHNSERNSHALHDANDTNDTTTATVDSSSAKRETVSEIRKATDDRVFDTTNSTEIILHPLDFHADSGGGGGGTTGGANAKPESKFRDNGILMSESAMDHGLAQIE